MASVPFSQLIGAINQLVSAIGSFGEAILHALGIPEMITIGSYVINTTTVFSIILMVITFFALLKVSGDLLRYVLFGILFLFVLTLISSVI